jgi:hypothetical protein
LAWDSSSFYIFFFSPCFDIDPSMRREDRVTTTNRKHGVGEFLSSHIALNSLTPIPGVVYRILERSLCLPTFPLMLCLPPVAPRCTPFIPKTTIKIWKVFRHKSNLGKWDQRYGSRVGVKPELINQ